MPEKDPIVRIEIPILWARRAMVIDLYTIPAVLISTAAFFGVAVIVVLRAF